MRLRDLPYKWLVAVAFVSALFMDIMDATVVNVALPTLGRDFRAGPPQERARAAAVMMVPIALAPAVGPAFGGWLVDQASWRWIFFVNLPVGIAALAFAAAFLQEHTEERAGRFDLPGFLLSGA